MPFLKPQKQKPLIWRIWEEKTPREGYRPAVFGFSKKEKYSGFYHKDLKHGLGTQTYDVNRYLNAETIYEGDWEKDKKHGRGKLSFDCSATGKTLNIYSGEWINDKMAGGGGMKSFGDGGMYKGDFKKGMRHGQGVMYYPDGVIYTGEWHNDKRHGVGRLVKDGNYYEGSFRDDKKCGLGRFYHVGKSKMQEGVWYDDIAQVTLFMDDTEAKTDIGGGGASYRMPRLVILKEWAQVYLDRAKEILKRIDDEEAERAKSEEEAEDKQDLCKLYAHAKPQQAIQTEQTEEEN